MLLLTGVSVGIADGSLVVALTSCIVPKLDCKKWTVSSTTRLVVVVTCCKVVHANEV